MKTKYVFGQVEVLGEPGERFPAFGQTIKALQLLQGRHTIPDEAEIQTLNISIGSGENPFRLTATYRIDL